MIPLWGDDNDVMNLGKHLEEKTRMTWLIHHYSSFSSSSPHFFWRNLTTKKALRRLKHDDAKMHVHMTRLSKVCPFFFDT